MKQIAQYQDGRLEIQEVPMPTAPPGGVLVRTTHSVISAGTERMKVEAVDLQSARRHVSHAMGAERVVTPDQQDLPDEVRAWTDSYGVDAALVCTGTQNNEPIEQAAEALRDRGRLVDVGITRMDLPWKTFYEKELEVRFARLYRPGRYDLGYEWGGADYPIGYVRWTEQRNFQACLHLVAKGEIDLAAITTRRVPFVEAPRIYEDLLAREASDIGVVLEYAAEEVDTPSTSVTTSVGATVASARPTSVRVAAPIERLDLRPRNDVAFDEPIADPAAINSYLRFVRAHATHESSEGEVTR